MEEAKFKIRWGRVAAAAFLSLIFFAVIFPNLGRLDVDHSTIPPTFIIKNRPEQIALWVAILLLPLACILFGGRRFWLELIGWVLLAGLYLCLMIG
jgi:hypothetical protein